MVYNTLFKDTKESIKTNFCCDLKLVIYLYENNVLKQKWKENKKGMKSDEFIAYKNGRVDFRQRFQDILEQIDSKRTVYHKKGLRMEIWSA